MNKQAFFKLLEKLEGINYFFVSGLSVAIHTNGEREPGDIDIAINEKDMNRFAKLMGTKPQVRIIDKGTFQINDFGFETNFEGQMVEATTGYPVKRMNENTFNKLFKLKEKKIFLGRSVFVEPIEELITQKAFMHRDKDIQDLSLLKNLEYDKNLLLELAKDKDNLEEITRILKKVGFKI
jgi:hypothetical protein